jgi:hypothetical protein
MKRSIGGAFVLGIALLVMLQYPGAILKAEEEAATETDLPGFSLGSVSVSPDRNKIVFAANRFGKPVRKTFIYWMDMRESKAILAAEEACGYIPYGSNGWSHNSRMFLFTTTGTLGTPLKDEHDSLKNSKIKIWDTATSALKMVISPNELTTMPAAFSPVTSESIAFYTRDIDSSESYLHLYNLKDGSSKQLTPDRLCRAYSWVWGNNGKEIYYCTQRNGACYLRAVDVANSAERDVLKLDTETEQLYSLPEGGGYCLVEESGLILFFTRSGEILRQIEPGNTLSRIEAMSWLDSERVAFISCSNRDCSDATKFDLAVSEDALKSYTIIIKGLSRSHRSSFDWITPQSLVFADGDRIVLISNTGEYLRTLFSLEDLEQSQEGITR